MNKGIIWIIVILVVVGAIVLFSGNTTQAPNSESAIDNLSNMQSVPVDGGTNLKPVEDTKVIREFVIEGSPFKFSVKEMRVNLGETVKVTFKNIEGKHDWRVDELDAATKIINAGEEETIEFVADKVGNFEYYCSVGNHRQLGMVGTLIVE